MSNKLNKLHLLIGLLLFGAFLFTGYYMSKHFPQIYLNDERLRFTFRSNHIYILMGSIIHLITGFYFRGSLTRWKFRSQLLGSLLSVLASIVLVAAFFVDNVNVEDRMLTLIGIILFLGSVVLHGIGAFKNQNLTVRDSERKFINDRDQVIEL